MLLAIDSGNTNTVFAVFTDDGEIKGEWRASTTATRTSDEYGVWLLRLMELESIHPADITDAIIATVVPATLYNLKSLCEKYFQTTALVVGEAGVDLGVEIKIENAHEVGADRLVNAVAANAKYGGPLICIDFGTATTFDVIDHDGNYAGGVIAPGINLSLEALHMAAAKLPRVAVERPAKVIGTGTVSAMQSGIYWGYVSMIEGMVARIREEFRADMDVVATGGLAQMFSDATRIINWTDKDLTLRGLYLIHKRNKG
ncbi:type III pantothenate kinase [Magnetovibrio sp.]|uniref:type III pantothenate kinase n=1 Tax=Magnetovibrio sp. TaxID=2024836 RepID=UPI002F9423D1